MARVGEGRANVGEERAIEQVEGWRSPLEKGLSWAEGSRHYESIQSEMGFFSQHTTAGGRLLHCLLGSKLAWVLPGLTQARDLQGGGDKHPPTTLTAHPHLYSDFFFLLKSP